MFSILRLPLQERFQIQISQTFDVSGETEVEEKIVNETFHDQPINFLLIDRRRAFRFSFLFLCMFQETDLELWTPSEAI